ncbi:unnamed protein product [Penicillium olsonii]|nr:unnamed protein product [Penicillium olsonii]
MSDPGGLNNVDEDATADADSRPATSSTTSSVNFVHDSSADLFAAPNGSALIHACNCVGRWGSGIATVFRANYPAAFDIYTSHCRHYNNNIRHHVIPNLGPEDSQEQPMQLVRLPLGTALVISPQASDIALHGRRHWIICLFVSRWYGARADSEADICRNVNAALRDLAQQLTELRILAVTDTDWPHYLFSNRFCSGLFRVPWEVTSELINEVGLNITVCTNSEHRRAPQHRYANNSRRPSTRRIPFGPLAREW